MSNRYTETDSEFLRRMERILSKTHHADDSEIEEIDLLRLSVLADQLAEAEAWVRSS